MIPVVDLFAGPGGLGEGFATRRDEFGCSVFDIGISIEKDFSAHETLRLRAFRRCFDECPPAEYNQYLDGSVVWEQLKNAHPNEGARAENEARHLELGPDTLHETRELISKVARGKDQWILVGGPPCQAYSLVGRARNNRNSDYVAELDKRQTLYVEYLQILADHAPPVFVMENVKGILSARLNSIQLFDRIRDDLRNPAKALRREGRATGRRNPKYRIAAVVAPESLFDDLPSSYVVRAERFGIPQRRHRVIIVGVREDFTSKPLGTLQEAPRQINVEDCLKGLPRLRSGLSKETDSAESWATQLRNARHKPWMSAVDSKIRARILTTLEDLAIPRAGRGAEYLKTSTDRIVLNHATRGHIVADLERYMFASVFSALYDTSPVLADFPAELLPKHRNVKKAVSKTIFGDRFRVQIAKQPATTVTSHISKDGHYYIHYDPSQCRTLTVREAARLQTFPDDYFFCGPRTAQYQQVGNAVPPHLAAQIAKLIADLLGS